MTSRPATRREAAARLAVLNASGALLNAGKFVLLPALLTAHELDVLAVGLLLALTLAQAVGEPLASHTVLRPGLVGARRLVLGLAAAVLLAAAVAPGAAAAVLAPGFELTGDDRLALRLFAIAGLGFVSSWMIAGRLQAVSDFSGLGVIALAPNIGLVVGALTGSVPIVAAAMLTSIASGCLVTARPSSEVADTRSEGPGVPLVDLLALSVATQLNLILLRTAASDLPEGSIGALYIAAGVAALPVMAIAGSAASVSLPFWRERRSEEPLAETTRVAALAGVVAALVVGGLFVLDTIVPEDAVVENKVRDRLRTAIPILAAGVPIYAAAWYMRALMIASGRARLLALLAAIGALAVPGARLVDETLAAISAGFLVSHLPWLAGSILLASRRAGRRAPAA